MKIQDARSALLSTRSLGALPPVNTEKPPAEGSLLLQRALQAEHQLTRVLHSAGISPTEPLQEKNSEIDSVLELLLSLAAEAPKGSIEALVCDVNAGHICLLNGDSVAAQKLLGASVKGFPRSHVYVEALIYKKSYLLSLLHNLLQDPEGEKAALISGVNSFAYTPTPSNIEAIEWLKRIYTRLNSIAPNMTVSQLSTVFKNKNFIISYANYTSNSDTELETFINERAQTLLSSVKFPRADEPNNYELEEFIDLITQSPTIPITTYTPIVERAMGKTYQSHIVLRSYIRCILQGRNQDDIRASIEVYSQYIKAYYEQNGHTYLDIISIVQVYDLLLKSFVHDVETGKISLVTISSSEYHYWLKQMKALRSLLLEFYSAHGFEKVVDVDVSKVLAGSSESSPLILSKSLRVVLSELWASLGHTTYLINLSHHSMFSVNAEHIEEAIQDYKHSIYLLPENTNAVLQYVKIISEVRRVKEAYRITKIFIASLPNTSLAYFESWHLLALILSVEENKDEAFKMINFILSEVTDLVESDPNTIDSTFKIAFIQIKMTQLAIIESLFGTEQALDSLPELFELFRRLFSSDIISTEEPKSAHLESAKVHRKSLSLTRTQTLSKLKSLTHNNTTNNSNNKPTTETHPVENQPTVTIKSNSIITKNILQEIWILAATIYAKLSLITESEKAIVEAENIAGATAQTHSTLALLSSKVRPQLALKEYESALAIDRDSMHAVIGFAGLVLFHDEIEPESIFISKKDKFASIARAKVMLENATETVRGAHTTEVWWLLAQIYGRTNDNREKKALWKSIELEETRPVRDFSCVGVFKH